MARPSDNFEYNVRQRGDALELLRSLPPACSPLVFFDPQFRALLERQSYGNEGERQPDRAKLPAMSEDYIDACCREIARVLAPSGYCMRWAETFAVCEGHHLRVKDVLPCVDKIVWDSLRMGMGYRSRHRGDELLILQRPPIRAKDTWWDHGIPNRWPEKVEPAARRKHPHIKPAGLIGRLIEAVTFPDERVVDPCAGSFVVLDECRRLRRRFIGCDIAYAEATATNSIEQAA
jgi:site-specific DNA-methyltransferase (adenine-specific)